MYVLKLPAIFNLSRRLLEWQNRNEMVSDILDLPNFCFVGRAQLTTTGVSPKFLANLIEV